jgi:hypothetical protein
VGHAPGEVQAASRQLGVGEASRGRRTPCFLTEREALTYIEDRLRRITVFDPQRGRETICRLKPHQAVLNSE